MNRILAALAAALLLAPLSALAATLNATPATFEATAKAAQPGDVVLLAPGSYEPAELSPIGVTIASADPTKPAVSRGLILSAASNVTLRDLEFVGPHPNSGQSLTIGGVSKGVRVERVNVHGASPSDFGGLAVYGSSDVTITASEFHHMQGGVTHRDSFNVTVSASRFHDLQSDAITGGAVDGLRIIGNSFADFYPIQGHIDAIQLYKFGATTAKNVEISGNLIDRGQGYPIQAIFLGNENQVAYENIKVVGNFIQGANYHGISIDKAKGAVVTDNVVQAFQDEFAKSWAGIWNSTDVLMTRNLATGWKVWGNTGSAEALAIPHDGSFADWVGEWGEDIAPAPLGDRTRLNAWLATRPAMAALVAGAVPPVVGPPGPAETIVTLNLGLPTTACRIDVERQDPRTKKWSVFQPRINTRCR